MKKIFKFLLKEILTTMKLYINIKFIEHSEYSYWFEYDDSLYN